MVLWGSGPQVQRVWTCEMLRAGAWGLLPARDCDLERRHSGSYAYRDDHAHKFYIN